MIGSTAGASAFLVFLLVSVQVTLHLFATTTAQAVGMDAARRVAAASVDHQDPASLRAAEETATTRLRRQLGRHGERAAIRWQVDDATVTLHLRMPPSLVLPRPVAERLGADGVDRSFVVHIEAFG